MKKPSGWVRVIYPYELDDEGNCPVCKIDYGDCPCPGPTQDDEFEYTVNHVGVLVARPHRVDPEK